MTHPITAERSGLARPTPVMSRDIPRAVRPPVVVAEDDPATVHHIQTLLVEDGYPVTVADDGEDALRRLMSFHHAIVISDWMMPGMDGIELCQHIRDSEDIRFAYFIMLTSHASITHRVEAFQRGVDDFITKPVTPEELFARLHAARRTLDLEQNLERQTRQAQYLNAELAILNEQLSQTASYDALTGVLNRNAGDEALRQRWRRSTESGRPLACLIVDINRFKQINDEHGHGVGDRALRWVGHLLTEQARGCDVVYRYGGDEFVVLCPDTDADQADRLADRLRLEAREESRKPDGPPVPIELAIGAASREDGAETPEALLDIADQRLYANKAA